MDSIYEHQFAKDLGVPVAVLKDLRKSVLEPGEWSLVQGKGISLTENGQKKLRAALAALPGLEGEGSEAAPAAEPVRRDFRIRRVFAVNTRIVEGTDGAIVANIRVRDSVEMGLQPDMLLPGCTPRDGSPVWNFTGRARR